MTDDSGGFLVKLGISALAVKFMLIPEPASTVGGFAVLTAIWGLPFMNDGGS